jgi:hypothetical protein
MKFTIILCNSVVNDAVIYTTTWKQLHSSIPEYRVTNRECILVIKYKMKGSPYLQQACMITAWNSYGCNAYFKIGIVEVSWENPIADLDSGIVITIYGPSLHGGTYHLNWAMQIQADSLCCCAIEQSRVFRAIMDSEGDCLKHRNSHASCSDDVRSIYRRRHLRSRIRFKKVLLNLALAFSGSVSIRSIRNGHVHGFTSFHHTMDAFSGVVRWMLTTIWWD